MPTASSLIVSSSVRFVLDRKSFQTQIEFAIPSIFFYIFATIAFSGISLVALDDTSAMLIEFNSGVLVNIHSMWNQHQWPQCLCSRVFHGLVESQESPVVFSHMHAQM